MTNLLPEKLTALRKHFQYPQAEVAKKLNVSINEYMNWENGNSICRIDQLKALADLYSVPLDDLIDNRKALTLPDLDIMFGSVQIPFQSDSGEKTADDASEEPSDEPVDIMPVTGVLPDAETEGYQADAENGEEETKGGTIEMDTRQFEPTTMNRIVENSDTGAEAAGKPANGKKPAPSAKMIGIIAGAAAAVILILVLILRGCSQSAGKTTEDINSLSTVNRLALADTFSVYINDSGKISTTGTAPSMNDFTDVVQVSAGDGFAVGLKKNGSVVTTDSSLSTSDWTGITMIAAGSDHVAGLKKDGTVVCAGTSAACAVSDWKDIQAVYAGGNVTVGVTTDSKIKIAGSVSSQAKLLELDKVKSVAVGTSEIAVIKSDGTYTCYAISTGSTSNTGTWTSMSTAALGSNFAAGLGTSGKVVTTSADSDMDKTLSEAVSSWTGVKYIAARGHTLIAIANGKVIGAGDNTNKVYESSTEESATPSAEAEQLNSVQNVKFTVATGNLAVTWDTVSNAGSYTISVSTSPETTLKSAKNSTSIPTSKLTSGTTYTFTITAISGDQTKYADSEPLAVTYTYNASTTQLAKPTNVIGTGTDTGWTITWDKVENAGSYTVKFDGNVYTGQTTNSYKIGAGVLSDDKTYNISVTAISSDTKKYTDSETTTVQLTYTPKTYTVTISFIDTKSNQVGSTECAKVKATEKSGCACTVTAPDGYIFTSNGQSTYDFSHPGTITGDMTQPLVVTAKSSPTENPTASPSSSSSADSGNG